MIGGLYYIILKISKVCLSLE